jgi:hypothetical protein
MPASSIRLSSSVALQEPFSGNEITHSSVKECNAQAYLLDSAMGYSKDKQEQDLLGLATTTIHDVLPRNEVNGSGEVLEASPQDQATFCAVHHSIFSNADKLPGQEEQLKRLPMDRYLNEGFAERYAILSLDDGRQWARYSSCVCSK